MNNFFRAQDQDLRKSLFPFSSLENQHRLTKFVRHRDSSSIIHNKKQEDPRINFNPQPHPQTPSLPLSQILQRYHDQSLAVKPRKLSKRQHLMQKWYNLIRFVLLERQHQRIFKKDSFLLLFWNFLVLYAYLFNIFEIPVAMFLTSAVYHDQFNTVPGLILNWLAIAIIIINILIFRPNTEFQNLGYLISNRKEIMQNYLGVKCFFDILGLLILIIYAVSYTYSLIFLKIFFYLDVLTIFEIDKNIIDKIQLKPLIYASYKLIRLLTYMLFILVWLSCIFFYIDYHFYVNQTYVGYNNWLTYSMCAFQVQDGIPIGTDLILTYPGAWYIWLNYAIYWSLQTVSTVGYGDITPRNPVSVIFTNISILIMMFFFVFFINSVIEIIDEMTSSEQKQKKTNIKKFKLYYVRAQDKLKQIALKYGYSRQELQNHKKALESTSNDIRSYLYEMDISNLLEEEENVEHMVNQNLTPELRDQLFINYRQLFFKKVLVFGEIAKISNQFTNIYEKLIYKIREVPFASDQVIYSQLDSNPQLHYLLKGTVLLQYPHSNYRQQISYTPNQLSQDYQTSFFNFGVRQFFTRQRSYYRAITKSYCKIQQLNYEEFISVMKDHKNFYFKFCELRDNIKFNEVTSFTGEQCFQCKSKMHHLLKCDKCLFNLRIHIKNVWQNEYRVNVVDTRRISNQRVPFYYRERIFKQKVNAINMISWPKNIEETLLISKFYKLDSNIDSFIQNKDKYFNSMQS